MREDALLLNAYVLLCYECFQFVSFKAKGGIKKMSLKPAASKKKV